MQHRLQHPCWSGCFGIPAVLTELCRSERQGPLEPVYRAALALGTANQLTNILRDVGEDAAERNRIYVPVDELDEFGISEAEVCAAAVFCVRSKLARFLMAPGGLGDNPLSFMVTNRS